MECPSGPIVTRTRSPDRRTPGSLRALGRALAVLSWTLLLLPLQTASVAVGGSLRERVPRLYHAGLCRILGIDVRIVGSPLPRRPALLVANHSSWLDVPILGSLMACSFVAKAEVSGWPGVGTLARLQRTVFVERRPRDAGAHVRRLGERLKEGGRLVLFPEGTSTDGSHVLPFKSALFSVAGSAADEAVPVQPVTVAYVRIEGRPAGPLTRPKVAWFGDMAFVPHLWGVLRLDGLGVAVTFHDPVPGARFESRKRLAARCGEIVATEHARLLSRSGSDGRGTRACGKASDLHDPLAAGRISRRSGPRPAGCGPASRALV